MLFKAAVKLEQTVCPGTNYQQSSVETQCGFVEADSVEAACMRAEKHYLDQNAESRVVHVLEVTASPATSNSTGFFVDFALFGDPEKDEEPRQTQTLKLALNCKAFYKTSCEVPVNLTLREAIDYAFRYLNVPCMSADPSSIELLAGGEEACEPACELC